MNTSATRTYLQSLFGLDGLTAVVIGGTGTLGGSFCGALAGAGAHVLVVGRDADDGRARAASINDAGGSAEFFRADATRRAELEAIVRHLDKCGRCCDVLVNGAGTNSTTPFLEISDDEWERIFNVNLNTVRLACQVFGKSLLDRQRGGSIINVASLSAVVGSRAR